jgi:hypothetical protein
VHGSEPIDPVVAELATRGELIVREAQQPQVLDRRGAVLRQRHHVIELQARRGPTDAAALERPLALALVTRPDLALDGGRDVVWTGRRRRRRTGRPRRCPRFLDDSFPLGVLLEQEVERDLEDVLGSTARNRVRQGVARGVELLQEAAGDGHVQPVQLRRERLDCVGLRRRSTFLRSSGDEALRCAFNRLNAKLTCVRTGACCVRALADWGGFEQTRSFVAGRLELERRERRYGRSDLRPTRARRALEHELGRSRRRDGFRSGADERRCAGRDERPDRCHHGSAGCGLHRIDRGSDCHRFLSRAPEEPRDDVVMVLWRDDLGELDDARHAKAAFAERGEHRGVPLHQRGCGLAVVSRAAR